MFEFNLFKSKTEDEKPRPEFKFLAQKDVVDADKYQNTNVCIFGSPGYGKTYAAQLLALRMCREGVPTYVFAPQIGKQDYYGPCKAANGLIIEMSKDATTHINILDVCATVLSDENSIGTMRQSSVPKTKPVSLA